MDKKFTFVLKDKGTSNEGWWLKVSNADELANYYESDKRMENVLINFIGGKHKDKLTEAVELHASNRNMTIFEGITSFQQMVAMKQLETIDKYGAIYINKVGGYNFYYNDIEYSVITRNKLEFPKENEYIEKCDKIKDEEYGFLSPDGIFYEGKFGSHTELAIKIIEQNKLNGCNDINGQNSAINFLIDIGFILIHDPSNSDYIVVNKLEPTKEQRKFLYKYFINVGNAYKAEKYKEN